jgi:hypothetical protein
VPTLELSSLPSVQSNAPLPAAGVYTGPWHDRYDDALVTRLRAFSFSDQVGTLYIEQSNDQTAIAQLVTLGATANGNMDTSWLSMTQRYYRVRYVNGATGQAVFWLWLATDVARSGLHAGTGPLTDRSGTIATANVSQILAAANPTRRYLFIQNLSTGPLWINFGAAATLSQPSLQIPNGNVAGNPFSMERTFVATDAVNIIGGTNAQPFVCKEGG